MTKTPFVSPFAALEHWARRDAGREAMAFPGAGRRMTFGRWRDDAAALARALLDRGVAPGDRVAVLAENRAEWLVVQLGVAAMGGVLVPLNTHLRRDDLAFALRGSGARVLFASPRFRSNEYLAMVGDIRDGLPDLQLVVPLDPDGAGPDLDALLDEGRASATPLPDVDAGQVGSLQYTSGTTGAPKGALLTHRGMMENAWQTGQRLRFGPGDRYTSIIPLFHCAGCIMGALGCLQNGAAYVGVPAFDAEEMFRVIEAERCTVLSGVPTSFLAMLNHPARGRYDLTSLRTGTCGGADANPAVLAACAAGFPMPGLVQVYGQTESSTLIAMADSEEAVRVEDCGRPLDGYEVRVTHPETGLPLPPGQIGQIEARGTMTMAGYHNQPDATRATLDADGWLRTGDLGRLSGDGRLTIAGGRLRDMIIRGGENVYPAEVENLLATHAAIAEAAVFGVADEYYGEVVAAAVRTRGPVTPAELATFCNGRIARFKTPAVWFAAEAFPLTSSGKIRKTELRDWVRDGRLAALE